MNRKQLNSKALVAGLALSAALVGCDAESARILATIAQQAGEAAQEAQIENTGNAWTAGQTKEGEPGRTSHASHSGNSGYDGNTSFGGYLPQGPEFNLQNNPWFGRPTGNHDDGDHPECQDGKCHEEPTCYPGTKAEFAAESAAVASRPLAAIDALNGKWFCASGQGYLKMAVDASGSVAGRIVFTAGGMEQPMPPFPYGRFEAGRLVFGGIMAGAVGQATEGAPFAYLATIRDPQGERLVRFTRETK